MSEKNKSSVFPFSVVSNRWWVSFSLNNPLDFRFATCLNITNSFMFPNLKVKTRSHTHTHTVCHWCMAHSVGTKIWKFFHGYSQASENRDSKYEAHGHRPLFPYSWQTSLMNHGILTELSCKFQILSVQCSKQVTPISQI